MKFLRGMLGFSISGIVLNTGWSIFTNSFGIIGGWIAAFVLTGSMWFMNHYVGLIENEEDAAFIDMGLGIAICIVMRDTFVHGVGAFVSSLPTFICISIGAVIGGVVVGLIEKDMHKKIIEENDSNFAA